MGVYLKNILISALVLCGATAAGATVINKWSPHVQTPAVQVATTSVPSAISQATAVAAQDVSHRAIYSFKMISVESGAGISGIDGQMYYQQQDACDAFVTEHKFSAEYQYPERPVLRNSSQYSSWEAKNGKAFYFNSDRYENGELVEQLRGGVKPSSDGGMVAEYKRPTGLEYILPADFVLPMAHTHMIIDKARAGEKFFSATLFDGTDGDGPSQVNAFIGNKLTPDEIAAIVKKNPEKIDKNLLDQDAWHVRLAVFPLKDENEMLPSYEMQMVQHANGVISHVIVDYRVFKVEQVLEALQSLPAQSCAEGKKG